MSTQDSIPTATTRAAWQDNCTCPRSTCLACEREVALAIAESNDAGQEIGWLVEWQELGFGK